eukprot:9145550-Alexandrium_andersonii.AAC.1
MESPGAATNAMNVGANWRAPSVAPDSLIAEGAPLITSKGPLGAPRQIDYALIPRRLARSIAARYGH